VFTQARASGAHEVFVLSPDHEGSWGDLDDKQAGLVMAALRDRFEEHARHPHIRYSQAIVNHGREAGASLAHPHGQLLGMPFVPGELAEELAGFTRFGEACVLCTTVEAEVAAEHRLVLADERVVVVAPFWSGSPFELLVLPRQHEAHLPQADPRDLAAAGRAVRDVLQRLRRTVGDVAYNLVFHTAPHHSRDAAYHWHIHVTPRITSVAGFEQGTGVLINIVAPELAAQALAATD
jgi:UDPglucose--hexose-1-phosphate uridylyltransferase